MYALYNHNAAAILSCLSVYDIFFNFLIYLLFYVFVYEEL